MWAKFLAFFKLQRPVYMEVKGAQSLSFGPSDFLVITCESAVSQAVLEKFQQRAREFFRSENVLVVAGDDVRLLKIAIEDKMCDEIMLKEEVTRWKN